MEIEVLVKFFVASIGLALMPGPDFLYVLLESLSRGKKRGVIASSGFASGVIIHTLLCIAGVSVLIASSEYAFSALKYAGAVYLAFLAYKSFKGKVEVPDFEGGEKLELSSNVKLFFTTFLMNVLNPKVLIFFMGFLPQFVDENAKIVPALQILVLGLIFMFSAFSVFSLTAVLSGSLREVFCKAGFWRVEKWFRVIFFAGLSILFLTF